MKNRQIHEHLSAERVQAFLEGALSHRERGHVEEHLRACARCAGEVAEWREVFQELEALGRLPHPGPSAGFAERVMSEVRTDLRASEAVLAALDELPRFAPSEGFAARVMSGVRKPSRLPLAARVRKRLARLAGAGLRGHVPAPDLHGYLDGALSWVASARVEAHLDACGRCRTELEEYRTLSRHLAELPHFGPSPAFAPTVLARLRRAPARSRRTATEPGGVLAWLRGAAPRSRRAWAALAGFAVTPVATMGLVLYAVFSHPTLTPGALASFAWWKAADLTRTALDAVLAGFTGSVPVFEVFTWVQTVSRAPGMLAAGFLLFSALTVGAAWVLYRNLRSAPGMGGPYAHV